MSALFMAVGIGLGWLVDHWLHSTPLFTIIGVFVGLVIGGALSWGKIRMYLHD
ncbi:MAG: AtpZ/AtpI family protein [Mycobacteriales bacterium]